MANNKHSDEEKKGFLKGTALGVAVGGLAGAAAGILFAPQSGRETRAQIASMLKKSTEQLEKKITQVKSKVSDFTDTAGRDLTKLLDRANVLKDEIKDFGKQTFDRSVDFSEESRKEARRLIDESQKIMADMDRILSKKLAEAKTLASDTKTEVSDSVRKNVKK